MIHISPTKRGIGVELWGTFDDLSALHKVIGKFWGEENDPRIPGAENREKVIGSLSYEVRKAMESRRMKKEKDLPFGELVYYGTEISWPHFLFALSGIKFNMGYCASDKLDVSMIMQIEYWLEEAMRDYDAKVAKELAPFVGDALHGSNEYIYQYMRSINLDFMMLGGGKKAFRKLPELMFRGVFMTPEYEDYKSVLEEQAKKLGCNPSELDINDDDFDYENLKW